MNCSWYQQILVIQTIKSVTRNYNQGVLDDIKFNYSQTTRDNNN